MRKAAWAALAAIFVCGTAAGQGTAYHDTVLRPPAVIAGASIRVCTEAATGTPCSPLATIYSDKALTSPDADSIVTADARGNFNFYFSNLTPACYKLQVSASGFSTYTYTVCSPFGGGTFYASAFQGTTGNQPGTGDIRLGNGRAFKTKGFGGTNNLDLQVFRLNGLGMEFGAESTIQPVGEFEYDLTFTAGRPSGVGRPGGSVHLRGGTGTSDASGGNGGDVFLEPGSASGSAIAGLIRAEGKFRLKSITYSAADTTPSVQTGNYMVVANGGAVSITAFDDGTDGQFLILKFSDANTTLVDAAGLQLAGGSNFNPTADDIVVLIRISSVWYELARSEN